MSFVKEEIEEEGEPKKTVYTAGEFSNDNKCAHKFKRVSPYQIQCVKCHVGFYDSPDSPFPVDELNEYFQIPEVQKYNKWL